MGLPTLLRNILGFPHPEVISPRGTPVGALFHALYLTSRQNFDHIT